MWVQITQHDISQYWNKILAFLNFYYKANNWFQGHSAMEPKVMADESLKNRQLLCIHMSYFTGPVTFSNHPLINQYYKKSRYFKSVTECDIFFILRYKC